VSNAVEVEGEGAQAPDLASMERRLGQHVQEAQRRLARAVTVGKLQNDPLADVVEAVSQSLAVQFELHVSFAREYRNAAADLEQQLRAAIAEARQPIDTAALERLERSAATGADRRAADLARARNWRTMLIYGGALAGAVLLALGGDFAWGRASANAAVAQTERRLAAAFADGPDAAAAWVGLMEQNDLPQALANCKGAAAYADQAGRKVCAVPLYVEPLRRGG
jgi:hypothetical protein